MAEGAEGKRSERDGRGGGGLGGRKAGKGRETERHRKGNAHGVKTRGGGVNLTLRVVLMFDVI